MKATAEPEWKGEIAELKSLIRSLSPGGWQAQDSTTAEVQAASGYEPSRPRFEGGGYNNRANDHAGFRWSDPTGGQQPFRLQYN